jgi:hypothetical protein
MRSNRGSALSHLLVVIALIATWGRQRAVDEPAAPYALSVGFVGANRIDLSWAYSSDIWHEMPHEHRPRNRHETADESRHRETPKPITGFKIERKLGGNGAWEQIATVASTVTAWSDGAVIGNASYYYRVCAYSDGGDSKWSNEASGSAIQAAPIGLTAAPWAHTVYLAWADHATDETAYKVERKPEAGAYSQVGTAGQNAISYADKGLSPGTYYYRVRASNDYGDSAYSNEASAVVSGQDKGGG